MLRQQTNILNDLFDLADTILFVLVQVEVIQALGNNVVNRCALVQRSSGILENHLDIPDDFTVQGTGGFAGNANALVPDFALGQGIDPDDGTTDGGLTGAGFTNQREGFTFVNIKGCVLNSSDGIFTLTESDIHVLQRQQYFSAIFINRAMLRQMGNACVLIRHNLILH